MRRSRRRLRGFTLPELIVGGVIVAMIAASVIVALSQAIDAERRARARQEAVRRSNAAADRVARDVRALARSDDLYYAHLSITPRVKGRFSADEVLMLTTASRSTPGAGADAVGRRSGSTHEVQYRLQDDPRGREAPGGDEAASVLWRRVDTLPDNYIDGGGVAFPVVEGVRSLDLRAHNGGEWTESWDTDALGYPHAVRIEVVAVSDDGSVEDRAVRIVPIDRVPLPVSPALEVGAR